MNRRHLLSSVGAAYLGLVGAVGSRAAAPPTVAVWTSEAASCYRGVADRATAYLGAALSEAVPDVEVSHAGSVPVSTERAYDLMASTEWPRTLAGTGDIADVNLLLTDGAMDHAPTGLGVPHVAAVGGAGDVAAMDPPEDAGSVVPYSWPAFATQVLLHECGHALGLDHDHGVVHATDDAVVASPMVSAYAWASADERAGQFAAGANACGESLPPPAGRERRLGLRFSDCALAALR